MRAQTKRIVRSVFHTLFVCFVSVTMTDVTRADFWYEDFTDGSLNDAGIEWQSSPDPARVPVISTDGLLASTDKTCCGSWLGPDWPADRPGWSIRTQGRLLQDHGFFGAGSSNQVFNLISWRGKATVGRGDDFVLADTDLKPFEKDAIVQLDTFDGVLRMWAWRDGEQPTADIAPVVERDFDLPNAFPYIWARSDDGPSAALFRWVAFSTDHMPVNMPVPLSDLIGDFSGNDILDIADIDVLAAAIRDNNIHPQFDVDRSGTVDLEDHAYWVSDLKHTWMGDANLDGNVNFADFVALADHFDGPGGWGQGDFNADGTVQFPDFLILASNYGMTSTAVATAVPEPCSAVLLMIGVLLRLVTRRTAAVR